MLDWTAAEKDYADSILNEIDPEQEQRQHRLYQDHIKETIDAHLKHLSNLGHDISKMIIVDDQPENFQLQPANGIKIAAWYGNKNDRCLRKLINILICIAEIKRGDIRDGMRRYK